MKLLTLMWTPDWSMRFSSSRVESRPRGGTRYLDVKIPCREATSN
ncbi:hypothetical protein HMPREF9597_01400 [Cutibacterium acnes HL005PA4]|nr:hypothetical protein HMPREF9589_01115 [Cutibacterium acnes HL059PA1]EFS79247.1 hypothetical protein HMPREF9597_01400 [Cutibacterium acnes HL005PA4]EFS82133.1 hypothetical protein HMPREF9598_01275 [Cutibacterium acnes HL050PA1]EFT17487.1 hypothetical protein HMPREF9564_02097 [Cutibacterium acnes HL053PA1]EFT32184.1 hypothetical protein HMPREF9595_00561 [Cutibacterium acnes HL005PA2]EFT56256.1 hypothetical protein HMPREF9610_00560 [Cutibacterium acnes HL027PA2]EFT57599.1 hypothetical protein